MNNNTALPSNDACDVWLDAKTFSNRIGVTPAYAKQMRWLGTGPRYHKIPGSNLVRYRLSDVIAWEMTWRSASSTSEMVGAAA